MKMADYARSKNLLGPKVIKAGAMYWCQVRPCLFRPLVPFQEYQSAAIASPPLALLGGIQYAVPPEDESNSFLNYLMFENATTYTVDTLDHNRKRQVRLASKHFVIRVVTDPGEFKAKAYLAYMSFYERTGYSYGSGRRNPLFFSEWTDALFRIPGVLILGGYRNGELVGVSLTLFVESTVIYQMFFCDTESVRQNLADLMLHSVRESSAACPNANQVFAAMYTNAKGLNDFYQLRGAVIVKKRAMLRLNPISRLALRFFLPNRYSKLLDSFPRSLEAGDTPTSLTER